MTRETAAARSAELLRQLDAQRQRDQDMRDTTRVACTEPGCRGELICNTSRHVANLEASWRCLEHRNIPTPRKDIR